MACHFLLHHRPRPILIRFIFFLLQTSLTTSCNQMANQLKQAAKTMKPLLAEIIPREVPPTIEEEPEPFRYSSFHCSGLADLGKLLASLAGNEPINQNPCAHTTPVLEIDSQKVTKNASNYGTVSTSTSSLKNYPRAELPPLRPIRSLQKESPIQAVGSNASIERGYACVEKGYYERTFPLGITPLIAPFILAIGIGYITSRMNAKLGWKE